MKRERLIDDVENAITKTYHHGGDWDECAAAAVDAVLTAIADEVEALSMLGVSRWCDGFNDGTDAAAGSIRALLGDKEGQNDAEDDR